MKTLASQLIAFTIGLIFLGLGQSWNNAVVSTIGGVMLLINWLIASLAWLANYQESSLDEMLSHFTFTNRK